MSQAVTRRSAWDHTASMIRREEFDVTEHNERVREDLREHYVFGAFKGVLYQLGRHRPRIFLVPCKTSYDPAGGSCAGHDDLDYSQWFCERRVVAQLSYFPGTNCWLQNPYDIIAIRQPSRRRPGTVPTCSRVNTTLHRIFSVPWRGNLIVVKRGRRDTTRIVNITPQELTLINALVGRWVQLELEKRGW